VPRRRQAGCGVVGMRAGHRRSGGLGCLRSWPNRWVVSLGLWG
jgi:hypothetical protein